MFVFNNNEDIDHPGVLCDLGNFSQYTYTEKLHRNQTQSQKDATGERRVLITCDHIVHHDNNIDAICAQLTRYCFLMRNIPRIGLLHTERNERNIRYILTYLRAQQQAREC